MTTYFTLYKFIKLCLNFILNEETDVLETMLSSKLFQIRGPVCLKECNEV